MNANYEITITGDEKAGRVLAETYDIALMVLLGGNDKTDAGRVLSVMDALDSLGLDGGSTVTLNDLTITRVE